jgi:hypothetical protein
LVSRNPAHHDWQKETKKCGHGRGKYTRDNGEGGSRRLRPVLEEWDKGGDLRVCDKEKSGKKK